MNRRQSILSLLTLLASLPGTADALPKSGDVLVADSEVGIWLIDGATHTLGFLVGKSQITSPVGVAVGPGNEIYVLDEGDGPAGPNFPTVWKLDPATTTATVVSSAGLLLRPKAIAVALDGSIYIADGGASTFSGLVIRIGAGGSQAALSSGGQPTGLAVDAFGNIEVSRTGEHKIESFSPDGTLLQSTPTPGFDASVIAATSGGLVYAFGLSTGGSTDGYKFDPESQSVSHFFGPLSDRIAGAAVEPNGDIAYVETGGLYPTVLSMHPDGTFSWIENRYYLHRFHNPLGVAVYGVRNGSVPARPTSWGRLKGIYRR